MTKGNATCETCPYWEVFPNDVAGACHHSVNRFSTSRAYHREWWCSAHPARQLDRLAAMAMHGLAAGQYGMGYDTAGLATRAYRLADAMLAERVRKGGMSCFERCPPCKGCEAKDEEIAALRCELSEARGALKAALHMMTLHGCPTCLGARCDPECDWDVTAARARAALSPAPAAPGDDHDE